MSLLQQKWPHPETMFSLEEGEQRQARKKLKQ